MVLFLAAYALIRMDISVNTCIWGIATAWVKHQLAVWLADWLICKVVDCYLLIPLWPSSLARGKHSVVASDWHPEARKQMQEKMWDAHVCRKHPVDT